MITLNVVESAWQDLRYAARLLRTNAVFFAVATLSLALGIGANTAIFQLLDAVRLRTLPVQRADQLAQLQIAKNEHCCSGNFSDRHPDFTYAQWEQIRDHQQAFSSIFAWGDTRFNLVDSGEAQFANGLWVSGDFFKTLAVQPLLGRLITSRDDHPGCGAAGAVISYAFWQRAFGGNVDAIGRQVSLDGHKLDVLGITPPGFLGLEVGRGFDVAVPICAEPFISGEDSRVNKREDWWLAIIGRLKPGWTLQTAASQAAAISPAVFGSTVPSNYRADLAKYYLAYKLTAMPAGTGVSELRDRYSEPLFVLLGIAGVVLLIACSNLANLMLARASTREREMAVRLAIGANRMRLVRLLLAECLLLTVIGTAVGELLAQILTSYLISFLSTAVNPVSIDLASDWRIFAFTAGVAILTCSLFGMAPALRATRTPPSAAMKASGRGMTADRHRFGLRRALMISQVALSLMLLVSALLFVRSLRNLLTLDAGFEQNGLLVAGIDLSQLNLSPVRRSLLYRELVESVRRVPGVEHAASARIVPVSGSGWNDTIEFSGRHSNNRMIPWFDRVSKGYFRTMGTALLAGRDFDQRDTIASPEVAIVNQEFSKKYLGNANPIGKEFHLLAGPGEAPHSFEIIGLIKNSKYRNLREDFLPLVFLAQSQEKEPGLGINLIVRSRTPMGALMPTLKKIVLEQNAGISLQFHVFQTQLEESLLRERLMATLSGFFGVLAAALATLGLYGVISYMVARRKGEIGIRIALGASRVQVMHLVGREAAFMLLAGLLIGTALAALVARTAASLLYGLKPMDPGSIALAIALLSAVAILASFVPALRAARVEPMIALREE